MTRRLFLLFLLAACCPAAAQTPGQNPIERAFAGDPQADPDTSVILENADEFTQTEPGQWVGKGNVRVKYRGTILTADRVDADLDAGNIVFTGNAVLKSSNGETVSGGPAGKLTINLRRQTYVVAGARTIVEPQALTVGIVQPLRISGGVISGQPGLIDARGAQFTTCDFLEPHYAFGARSVTIIPDKRLVARRVTFYRKNRAVFSLPYLVVPLDRKFARQTIFPQVGQTPDEGIFVKFALGYALSNALPGIVKLDLMQRKGVGAGFEQTYNRGVFALYRLADRSTGNDNVTGSLRHAQVFGTVSANFDTTFQQNSYFAGASRSRAVSSNLNLTRVVGPLNLGLRTNLSTSDYGVGASQTLTSSLLSQFTPDKNTRVETKFDFSQFLTPSTLLGSGTNRRQLDSSFNFAQTGRVFDLQVLANKFTRLSGSNPGVTSFFGGLERLPELRLATDAPRLRPSLGRFARFVSPAARLNLSLGGFNEPSTQKQTERARVNFDLGTLTRRLSRRDTLEGGGAFTQGFYSDNTAQYVLDGRTALRRKIGAKSSASLSYTYLRPYGYTPLQLDITGQTNVAGLNFAYQETPKVRLALGTAYDFNRTQSRFGLPAAPWQNLAAQLLLTPSEGFRLRTTASYDLNSNELLDLTNSLRVRASTLFSLDASSRFDPRRHVFSQVTGSLDARFFYDANLDTGYRLRAIGGYNGYTKRFEYKGLAVTRSWHDYELSLIYQDNPLGLRPGSQITLNFRLKAFPASEPFAVGQLGQSLDSGIGAAF